MEKKRLMIVALVLGIAVIALMASTWIIQNQKNKVVHEKFSFAVNGDKELIEMVSVVEMRSYSVQSSVMEEDPYFYNIGFHVLNGDTVFSGYFRQGEGAIKSLTRREAEMIYKVGRAP